MSTISNKSIARAIYQSQKEGVPAKKVVEFLARRRLLSQAPEILSQLQKIDNAENGILPVKVKVAQKLTQTKKKEIERFVVRHYSAKKIILNEEINEKLLGGVRLEVNDEVIDLTLENKINKLEEHLINS